MAASQSEIKARIDELRLSLNGYNRQLGRPDLSAERAERLETEVGSLSAEIATLEKLAQLVRLEPDGEKVTAAVTERLAVVTSRLAAEPAFAHLEPGDVGAVSGEAKALLWALGRDKLTLALREVPALASRADPDRTARALPNILIHTLEDAPDPDARAGAAYELGKLGIAEAIPALVTAANDADPSLASAAFRALARFPDADLIEAGVAPEVRAKIRGIG